MARNHENKKSLYRRILLVLLIASAPLTAAAEDWETNAEMFRAVRTGNPAGVKSALAAGADIHAKTPDGFSSLALVASNGNAEVVQVLLDAGATEVNESYRLEKLSGTPLAIAAWVDAPAVVELLLKHGGDPKADDHYALRGAIFNASQANVLALLGAGEDANCRFQGRKSPLSMAAAYGHTQLVALLLDRGAKIDFRDDRGDTALMLASAMGRAEAVERLVQRGASLDLFDTDGVTALAAAAQGEDAEARARIEKALRAAGAKREAVQRPIDQQYLLAAHQGDVAKVKQLLDQGAELEVRGKVNTTLWLRDALSASVAHPEVCALLLERGINPYMRDGGGFTALHAAAQRGSMACIEMLQRAGLDPNDKAEHGQTALYMANNERRPPEIMRALSGPTEEQMSAPPELVCAADADARQEVRIRHLHIQAFAGDTGPGAKAATTEELQAAYRKMQLARSELLAGSSFAEVAQKYTDFRKAAPNPEGDLGFVKRKFLPSQMDRVVFCLPVGAVSPVFRTSFGFHVVQVVETR